LSTGVLSVDRSKHSYGGGVTVVNLTHGFLQPPWIKLLHVL